MTQRLSIEITQAPHARRANIRGRVWPYSEQMGLILICNANPLVMPVIWDRPVLQDVVKGIASQMMGWASAEELPFGSGI